MENIEQNKEEIVKISDDIKEEKERRRLLEEKVELYDKQVTVWNVNLEKKFC